MNSLLFLDYKTLSTLIENHNTPFYFYNKRILRDTVSEIKNAFPLDNFQLLFATMANDNHEFLSTIRERGVGACINSIRHLRIVKECGFSKSDIQFTSTGLSSEDLDLLSDEQITINLDSITQLRKWLAIRKGLKAGIRINTSSLTEHVPVKDRLGIAKDELNLALDTAHELGGSINGLHIYIGTNYRHHNEMLPALEAFYELGLSVPELDYLNIGGGVGINYMRDQEEFDLKAYGSSVSKLTEQLRKRIGRNVKLVFEPGRRLAAPSGMFVTKVTDVKELNSTRYVVVDASIAVFPRPFHHPETPHKVFVPFRNGENGYVQSVVVGKTTFSRDIMSIGSLPTNIAVGDILVFDQAGAYCDSMRSRFLGQAEPQNVFVDE